MVTTVYVKWLVCALGWQMHEQVNKLRTVCSRFDMSLYRRAIEVTDFYNNNTI